MCHINYRATCNKNNGENVKKKTENAQQPPAEQQSAFVCM